MGFISFSLNYYISELQELESSIASPEIIYKAKQLLKMLDDLLDEGCTELTNSLEKLCQGISRLRKYLSDNIELSQAINDLTANTRKSTLTSEDQFLTEIIPFLHFLFQYTILFT